MSEEFGSPMALVGLVEQIQGCKMNGRCVMCCPSVSSVRMANLRWEEEMNSTRRAVKFLPSFFHEQIWTTRSTWLRSKFDHSQNGCLNDRILSNNQCCACWSPQWLDHRTVQKSGENVTVTVMTPSGWQIAVTYFVQRNGESRWEPLCFQNFKFLLATLGPFPSFSILFRPFPSFSIPRWCSDRYIGQQVWEDRWGSCVSIQVTDLVGPLGLMFFGLE